MVTLSTQKLSWAFVRRYKNHIGLLSALTKIILGFCPDVQKFNIGLLSVGLLSYTRAFSTTNLK
jgi:hypothetical protein